MSAFWVRFNNGAQPMCVEGETEAAVRARAATVGEVKDIRNLPYPANPRMKPYEEHEIVKWDREQGKAVPTGQKTVCPEFCYSPEQCAGRTACPKDYACSE